MRVYLSFYFMKGANSSSVLQQVDGHVVAIIFILVVCVFVQEDKVYVQHRVKEQAKLLWDLIVNKNAFFYIAG